MHNATRLPGILFEAEPRRPETVLPRMDITAFVGFAASGPLHTPIAIEDKGRFRELFGADITLAWDEQRRAPEQSLLGGAVESFFQNGGRRCWVVRVGPSDMPQRCFKLNGLVPAGLGIFDPPGSRQDLAEARARSPGSWAAEVIVDTMLQRERLPHHDFDVDGQRHELFVSIDPAKLRAGELLEIVFGSEQPKLYLFLDSIEATPAGIRLSGSEAYWYRPLLVSPPEPDRGVWELINETQGLAAFREWQASESPLLAPSIYLLRFEIRTRLRGNEQRIGDLAFHRDHPRAWMRLPDDAALFRLSEGRRPPGA